MSRHKFKKPWVLAKREERLAAEAAVTTPAAEPEPSNNEPRFNARKHNYTGQHVAITAEEQTEFQEIFDGFATDYGLKSATHLSHIEEASKAKLQIRRIERDLPKAIEETGYDSQKVVLMHRYLKEHRSQLRYALNALMAIQHHDFKRQVEGPARLFGNQLRVVNTAIKSTETEFLRANPNVLNDLFKAAGVNATAPPPRG